MKTVILAAGFGSRLWPLSTSEKPKQFQPLIGGESLLAYTYSRLSRATPIDELYVLVLEGMQKLVYETLPDIQADRIVVVPARRNTLPHTLWALNAISERDDEPVLFKSVDHFIVNEEQFVHSLSDCLARYQEGLTSLTLLCTPYETYNSNDGYCVVDGDGAILEFLEKPSKITLEQIVVSAAAAGHKIMRSYFVYLASKQACLLALDEQNRSWMEDARRLLSANAEQRAEIFLSMPVLDISNAIFQASRTLKADAISYDFIDVGRFEEIHRLNKKDDRGNVVIGSVILDGDCWNNLIINENSVPLVVISRRDSVIAQTGAGSFISSFQEADKIGEIYKKQIHGA